MAVTRAITLVDAAGATSGANLTSGSFTLPTGWVPGDLAIFVWFSRDSGRTFTKPTGATEKVQTSSSGVGHLWIGWRYLVSGDTTFAWSATSSTNNTDGFFTIVFRDANSSAADPFEQISGAGATTFTNVQSPDPPAISAATVLANDASTSDDDVFGILV